MPDTYYLYFIQQELYIHFLLHSCLTMQLPLDVVNNQKDFYALQTEQVKCSTDQHQKLKFEKTQACGLQVFCVPAASVVDTELHLVLRVVSLLQLHLPTDKIIYKVFY